MSNRVGYPFPYGFNRTDFHPDVVKDMDEMWLKVLRGLYSPKEAQMHMDLLHWSETTAAHAYYAVPLADPTKETVIAACEWCARKAVPGWTHVDEAFYFQREADALLFQLYWGKLDHTITKQVADATPPEDNITPLRKGAAFMDGHAMHRKHPDTFEIPSAKDIAAQKLGDQVKVCVQWTPAPYLRDQTSGERFWVTLATLPQPGKTVLGFVDNDLVYTKRHGIKYGDLLEFEIENIIVIK